MKKVLLFGDFGKDLDDEIALIVLASYIKSKQAQIVGIVATGEPAGLRACIAKGTLEKLGIDAPVFVGSNLSLGTVQDYEKDIPYLSSAASVLPIQSLKDYLKDFGEKELSMIINCAFTDVNSDYVDLNKIGEVMLQGGIVKDGEKVGPDLTSYNCFADAPAAEEFFKKIQALNIPLYTIDREVVYQSAVDSSFYHQMAEVHPVLGPCLSERFFKAISGLWDATFAPAGSELRGMLPLRCTPEWFLQTYCDTDEVLPHDTNIVPLVRRATLFDPINVLALFERENLFMTDEIFSVASWKGESLKAKDPIQLRELLKEKILETLRSVV